MESATDKFDVSFTCGKKNLFLDANHLRAAVNKAKLTESELQATPQQAAQHTTPAAIGTLTTQVSNSIPTGSGNAHTAQPGTGSRRK